MERIMSQITLELENIEDEQLVLSLLQRLGIHYLIQKENEPNNETIAAIEDARNGKVERYSSLEALWTDLDGD
jgi:hypothetical protein